jgi:hypothetical protein
MWSVATLGALLFAAQAASVYRFLRETIRNSIKQHGASQPDLVRHRDTIVPAVSDGPLSQLCINEHIFELFFHHGVKLVDLIGLYFDGLWNLIYLFSHADTACRVCELFNLHGKLEFSLIFGAISDKHNSL